MSDNKSTEKAKESVPACFFFADMIDRSISGYQVCKAIQQVIGTRGKVTGAQILNGLYRIYLSTNEARRILIAQGVTIGDTYVSVIEVNPKIVHGAENSPSVKLIIGNIPLSISNDEIETELKKLEGVHLKSRLFFENYRDDEGGLSSFKTGRRFAYINPPPQPLPHRFQMGSWKPSLYHWGQKTKGIETPKQAQDEPSETSEKPKESNSENRGEKSNSTGGADNSTNNESKGESEVNKSLDVTQSKIDSFINPRRSRSKTNRSTRSRSRSGSSRKRVRSPVENYQHSPSQKSRKSDPKGAGTRHTGSTHNLKKSSSQHTSQAPSAIQVKSSFNPLSKTSSSPR